MSFSFWGEGSMNLTGIKAEVFFKRHGGGRQYHYFSRCNQYKIVILKGGSVIVKQTNKKHKSCNCKPWI